ncbi:hypothetical protein FVEG_10360 [Fusarium verticillioides 7600]|uniref:Uncharacterized protein n=1 Tax=Gibberella moniliformis (strain M3125 / FGSC 7600) TaxID=334819 RepID=W7MJU1_GIBM7|nr:hypothetical protein FVEG_10360 [Fusarium verticillioides 7600]EWG51366.1 hypothetical protein FVEG_10360 [Fusarium verticillioides 7600]
MRQPSHGYNFAIPRKIFLRVPQRTVYRSPKRLIASDQKHWNHRGLQCYRIPWPIIETYVCCAARSSDPKENTPVGPVSSRLGLSSCGLPSPYDTEKR